MSYKTARPYLAAFLLLRRSGKIAFILRSQTEWMNGYYGLPAGKAEVNERASAAAVREAMEEAGVVVRESDLQFVHACHRYSSDNTLAWVDILFEAHIWKGEPNNAEPHKHSELIWIDPDSPPDNTIPAVKHFLTQIQAGVKYSEYGWKE
ncbi:MAG: NUDIX domain-containing protein [Patescibacteria group bacterium]